jgi:hypothetical protein
MYFASFLSAWIPLKEEPEKGLPASYLHGDEHNSPEAGVRDRKGKVTTRMDYPVGHCYKHLVLSSSGTF